MKLMVNNGTSEREAAFTIVELLIVVVVIAILAALALVSYNGISNRARVSLLKTDLESAAKQIQNIKTTNGTFPADTSGINKSSSTVFSYSVNNTTQTFCISATTAALSGVSYYVNESGAILQGTCPLTDGVALQTVTTDNCPTTRIRAVDARDNHTYWVQKLTDGKCWMLTNLGYAGGGTNTYGDVRTFTNDTPSYTVASSFNPPGSNATLDPSSPSTTVDGGSTNPQYGYYYNFCGAHGGQSTAACAQATLPAITQTISACPSGWRLPNGSGGEFAALNASVNGGSTTQSTGLRTNWLSQYAGFRIAGSTTAAQGIVAYYWSQSLSASGSSAYAFRVESNLVDPAYEVDKTSLFSVRCVAV